MHVNLAQLVQAVGGRCQRPLRDWVALVGPAKIDSRQIEPGDVFWTLAGPRRDGADFVAEAIARGARGIVSHRALAATDDVWTVQVDDTFTALRAYAEYKRDRFCGAVAAVTGSVGKTAARDMIAAVLAARFDTLASRQNHNNSLGLPLTMTALADRHEHAVFELGASATGELKKLAELCRPEVGVLTAIGDAHLGGFGSRQAIAYAKAELLDALPANGWAVLNGDDPWLRRIAHRSAAPVVWVGRSADCDVRVAGVASRDGQLRFEIEGQEFQIPVWGRHHVVAASLAVAVGLLFDVPLEAAAGALAAYRPQPMRCEVSRAAGATIINDAYNSSPTAMQAALELLSESESDASGRRIVICGDMAELGDASPTLHRQIGREVVERGGADLLVACGNFAGEVVAGAREAGMPAPCALAFPQVDDALPLVRDQVASGDVVLVKGSRVMRMERLVAALQMPHRAAA